MDESSFQTYQKRRTMDRSYHSKQSMMAPTLHSCQLKKWSNTKRNKSSTHIERNHQGIQIQWVRNHLRGHQWKFKSLCFTILKSLICSTIKNKGVKSDSTKFKTKSLIHPITGQSIKSWWESIRLTLLLWLILIWWLRLLSSASRCTVISCSWMWPSYHEEVLS